MAVIEHTIRHEESMCGPHGERSALWLGLMWGAAHRLGLS